MKRWLVRIFLALAIFEVAYLAIVNTVLNLPATQAYINRIEPDSFRLTWDRAWSWYPFRIQATEFSGNFQTWSQQWQISVPQASASLAVVPLLWKTMQFHDMTGGNIDLRLRPRPTPDRKDADRRQYYPTIEGRDPNLPADPVPSQSPGWQLVFEIAQVDGQNDIWIWGTKATLEGVARATIIHQGRHGPLTVENGAADLAVKALSVDGHAVSKSGSIKASLDLASFIPYENRGLQALTFMSLDANFDLPVDDLDFLNGYLSQSSGMSLSGTGALKGRIVFDKGNLLTGTELEVAADGLKVAEAPYVVDGTGVVDIAVKASAPRTLAAAFQFDRLSLVDEVGGAALFTGKDLKVAVDQPAYVLPGGNEGGPDRVALDIPEMTVADLTAYQRFLPDKWRVALVGGSGSLQGQAEMSATRLDADLTLRSEDASVKFKDESFQTNLEFVLKAAGKSSADTASVDISGSHLNLDDSRVKLGNGDTTDNWKALLSVSTGAAEFDLPKTSDTGAAGFWKLAGSGEFKSLLDTLDGQFNAELAISSLDWANSLLNSPYTLAFEGGARIGTNLNIRSGYLAEGSKLAMQPQKFAVEFLDYVAEGNGGFDLTVAKGGDQPDLNITANLSNASFRHRDEKQAAISDVTLALNATASGVTLKNGGEVTALDLTIPSAKVTDMTAYNAYFPSGSPLQILSGKADLNAKVDIQESSATGFVKLKTSRIEADIDGQRMSGTAGVDVKINSGSAKDKTFDITGSSLTVDGVRLAGNGGAGSGWYGRIDFGKSRVTWTKRATLDATTSIRMTDTKPLIEIFSPHRKGHEWLDRILNLKDVRANATIKVKPKEFVVPYALAKSNTIEVGVKGFIGEQGRQGIFYAKYGILAAILEFDNGKRHFGLINATKKFEDYVPGDTLPGMRASR